MVAGLAKYFYGMRGAGITLAQSLRLQRRKGGSIIDRRFCLTQYTHAYHLSQGLFSSVEEDGSSGESSLLGGMPWEKKLPPRGEVGEEESPGEEGGVGGKGLFGEKGSSWEGGRLGGEGRRP